MEKMNLENIKIQIVNQDQDEPEINRTPIQKIRDEIREMIITFLFWSIIIVFIKEFIKADVGYNLRVFLNYLR